MKTTTASAGGLLLSLGLTVLAGCEGEEPEIEGNDPPVVSLTSPVDGERVLEGAALYFTAVAFDDHTAVDNLTVTWTSDLAGELSGTQTADSEQLAISLPNGLIEGEHVVTVRVSDEEAVSSEDMVNLNVVPNVAPTIAFLTPMDGDRIAIDTDFRVSVDTFDPDESDLNDLVLTWGDDADVAQAPANPDSDGRAEFLMVGLAAGTYWLSVTVTDGQSATDSETLSVQVVDADMDGDGFLAIVDGGEDCDDADPMVNPLAVEQCDGIDNDCDGVMDEPDATDAITWYFDGDGDGFGVPAPTVDSCNQPSGYADNQEDCNDTDATINPNTLWYYDSDGDRFGDIFEVFQGCDQPFGYVDNSDDCDDQDSNAFPGGFEVCNELDDDCDGYVDEGVPANASTWYVDADGDHFGDAADSGTQACDPPTLGHVLDHTDCDDADATAFPGAAETCDTVDNDCDSQIDEDATDASLWYPDTDSDTYGDATQPTRACSAPPSHIADNSDCNDSDGAINPAATEVCDGADNDCDGEADVDATGAPTWHPDVDGDGFGDPNAFGVVACNPPDASYLLNALDCDDGDATAFPGATEYCDGTDNDCDTLTDEDEAADATLWFADVDGDGFGDATTAVVACAAPPGTVADDADCDDTSAAVSPNESEVCNTLDDNCDGTVDEPGATGEEDWTFDGDGDGFGDSMGTTVTACNPPSAQHVRNATDCNDASTAAFPGATEYCDGIDNDCDVAIDEDESADALLWYVDNDNDGFGDPTTAAPACGAPSSAHVTDGTDCNDANNTVNSTMTEVCNGYDDDCDSAVDEPGATGELIWYQDLDGDQFGDESDTGVSACNPPSASHVLDDSDCLDANPNAYPGATEYCDGADNDCDGATDENESADADLWYLDGDGDGYGDPTTAAPSCSAPSGNHLQDDQDCDDGDAAVNPGATEACNGYDDDCDDAADEAGAAGEQTWYIDGDGDNFGDVTDGGTSACAPPSASHVLDHTDCLDSNPNAWPDATETCDTVDNDCDGNTDEDDAADAVIWYIDVDGDGYGDATTAEVSCYAPSGAHILDDQDCDDSDGAINPGATELCDGADNDCDAGVDEPGASGEVAWYVDGDGDNFGAGGATVACDPPTSSHILDNTDCDDGNAARYPGNTEVCDGSDNDCDGTPDDNAGSPWFQDGDGDGYGDDGNWVIACSQPGGYIAVNGDCNDASASVNPGEYEIWYDGIDGDCDGWNDYDQDADGYDASAYGGNDCNDLYFSVNVGGTEVCDDGLDNNCDTLTDCEDIGGCENVDAFCWVCSDGDLDPGETCDDGNLTNGDGCDSFCQDEVMGNGCSAMASFSAEIEPDLWLCAYNNVTGKTWPQTYGVCNEAGGFYMATVGPMTRRGLPANPAINTAMAAAAANGHDYIITGHPTRSCSWDSVATPYETTNGLGYINTSERDGTGSGWMAVTDGNDADLRLWPAANSTTSHVLASLCMNAWSDPASYVFDHRWR